MYARAVDDDDDDDPQMMLHPFDDAATDRPVAPSEWRHMAWPSLLITAGACATFLAIGITLVVVLMRAGDDTIHVDRATREAWAPYAAAFAHIANRSAQACRDGLYAHVCGGWDRPGTSSFGDVADGVLAQLQSIAGDRWPLVGTWYTACMDSQGRATHGMSALQPVLAAIGAVHDGKSWARALAAVHAAGVGAVFTVYTDVDDAAPGRAPQLLYVDEAVSLLPAAVWAGNDTLSADRRQSLIAFLSPLMPALDVVRATALDSTQLAPFLTPPAALRTRDRRNIVPRNALPGPFAWDEYWDALMSAPPANVSLAAPAYVATPAATLAARNDWATLRAYLTACVYVAYADALPSAAPATSDDCALSAADAFGDMLGHLWAARFFPANTTRPAIEAMIRATIAAFGRRIDASPWMDAPTRTAAHKKLDAIHVMVGFPDTWDVTDPPFQLATDDHLHNVVAWRVSATADNLAAAGTQATRYRWLMPVFAVNAYYEPTANDIVFPAGILRGAFYAADAPLALNWGAIGVVIGHEITHGFDDQGRAYDANGARRNWWSPAAAAAFDERAACVVALYDALPGVGGQHVNGNLTLGENIADMGGIAVAYDAYTAALAAAYPSHAARRKYEYSVRNIFGMTHEQLFYAGFARLWCASRTPDDAYARLLSDPHAPSRWRVDAPTSQSAAYAAAYGCRAPNSSACIVW